MVTLATAHPAKFRDAVERATGMRPALPARVGDLFEREERCANLPGDYAAMADMSPRTRAAGLMADCSCTPAARWRGLGGLRPDR